MKVIVTYILSFIFLLSLLGGLNSCREEIDVDDRDTLEVLPVELINTNISGQVKNLEGKIIRGANVLISDQAMLTDQNGYFSFSNIKADRNGTIITVEKDGYLQNKITVYPSLNHDLFSSITLIEDNSSATMLSWQGGEVVLGETGTLYIPPNTLVYASDGSNFEGTAQIHFHQYKMDDPLLEHLIPGDLTAYIASNVKRGLIPASILRISISDGKLNDLRLATGQTAELNLVPSEHYLDQWPEELSMYRFSEENNQWIKTGAALSLESNLYTALIHDLGFICLGKDYDIVQLEGNIQYSGNNSTARHRIAIASNIQKPEILFQTDEQGHFKGFVPAATPLTLEISNECGFEVYEENIEELLEDTDFEKELQVNEDCRSLPVQGRLLDCEGSPVANGYVRITSEENDLFVTTDEEGYYQGEFKICDKNLKIDLTAYDRSQGLGTILHHAFPVENAIHIADWKICESAGDIGLQFKDGFYFLTDDIQFKISSGSLILQGFSTFLEIDFVIWNFRGEDVYTIPSDISAEFIITFSPKADEMPKLVPKDSLSLWTYKLIVENYVENEYIEGSVVGLARDENNNNEEGMFFMRFIAPFVAK
jgi:hypothetical protein